jgi:hypothetical protein
MQILHVFGDKLDEDKHSRWKLGIGRWINVWRIDCLLGENRIHWNYFVNVLVYDMKLFWRHYRMNYHLFLCIMECFGIQFQ